MRCSLVEQSIGGGARNLVGCRVIDRERVEVEKIPSDDST